MFFSRCKTFWDFESQKVVSVFSTLQYLKKIYNNRSGYINILVPLPLGWWPPKPHAPNMSIPPRATQPHPPRKHAYLKPGRERINHTHPEKMYNLKQNNSDWSGWEMKCFTLFFCLFNSFLHQQSNLRPHDICQSFQTLLENTCRNMHTNTIWTGRKLRVLNSVITYINHQLNYLVTKHFSPQYSSVDGLILINYIWRQRETKHRLTDIFHVLCGENLQKASTNWDSSHYKPQYVGISHFFLNRILSS